MEIFEKAKEKPDTAATVSDSEQENVCENIPADIVSQPTGNVKAIVKMLVSDAEWRAFQGESANSL